MLTYDPETGEFCRRIKSAPKGKYLRIKIDGRYYQAHQLAWLYVHGTVPDQVDHRDLEPSNVKLINLRPCTHAQNMMNRRTPKNSVSGIKGVRQLGKRWNARVIFEKRHINLGMFATPELAKEFRDLAIDLLHGEFANHG